MPWKKRYLHPLYRYQFTESIETADNNEIHHFTSFSFSSLRLFLNSISPKDVEILIHSPNLRMNMVLFVNRVFVSGWVKMTSLEQAWRGWATAGRRNSGPRRAAGVWILGVCLMQQELGDARRQPAASPSLEPSRLLGQAKTLVPAILFQAIQLEVTSGFASKAWQPPWHYLSLDG